MQRRRLKKAYQELIDPLAVWDCRACGTGLNCSVDRFTWIPELDMEPKFTLPGRLFLNDLFNKPLSVNPIVATLG